MRYVVVSLVVTAAVAPISMLAQDSTRAASYPTPTTWSDTKPVVDYDRFTDSTAIVLRLYPFKPGGRTANLFRNSARQMIFSYRYAGKVRPDSITTVTFVVGNVDRWSPRDTSTKGDILLLLNDSSRVRLAATVIPGAVDAAFVAQVPVRTFLEIVAASRVEGKAERSEFGFDPKSLNTLRNFAARMAPGVPLF